MFLRYNLYSDFLFSKTCFVSSAHAECIFLIQILSKLSPLTIFCCPSSYGIALLTLNGQIKRLYSDLIPGVPLQTTQQIQNRLHRRNSLDGILYVLMTSLSRSLLLVCCKVWHHTILDVKTFNESVRLHDLK